MKKHYFLFRVHGDQFRMERATSVEEACRLAFGVVYKAPYNGSVVYKNIGTRSPKYTTNKVKQTWYEDKDWKVIEE